MWRPPSSRCCATWPGPGRRSRSPPAPNSGRTPAAPPWPPGASMNAASISKRSHSARWEWAPCTRPWRNWPVHELAATLVDSDPATARQIGVLDPGTGSLTLRLPSTDPDFYADLESRIEAWAQPATSPEGTRAWLEERCIHAEVAYRLHELRVAQ